MSPFFRSKLTMSRTNLARIEIGNEEEYFLLRSHLYLLHIHIYYI
jgi:hypothetical protein